MSDINPKVDLAFKKIFGVEENKDLTISLINSIVSREDQIRDLRILNPYNLQDFKDDKLSILDVKAEGHNGKRYHIEIQISDEGDYDKRALHNWAKTYTEQLAKGDDYKKLNKTIGIHILYFLSIPEVKKYHNVFQLREKDSGVHYFSDMELHTIELRKFESELPKRTGLSREQEELQDLLAKVGTALDIWVAFLTRHDLLDRSKLPKPINDPCLKKALEVLDVMNLNPREREEYEAHLQWIRVTNSTINKIKRETAAEAEARGKAEGITEGEVKGILKMARKLLSDGMNIKKIIQLTGLSEDAIRKGSEKVSHG